MEAIIGEYLRKVAIESIEEATDTEVKMKLKNEIYFKQYKNKNLPVGVTVFFDIGWNKQNSDNRYDSISGHVLVIGYLSKKIFAGVVSSKMYIVCSNAQQNVEEPSEHVYPKNMRALPK